MEPTGCLGFYQCTTTTSGAYTPCATGLLFDTRCMCCNWADQVMVSPSGRSAYGRGPQGAGLPETLAA
jgi:hypothetical protein